jgi:predicted enzyme related to lactoylglutathione lyase
MTDPYASDALRVLRSPDTPIDPSAAFAADLRARLVRALATGATMTTAPENGLRQGDISYVTLAVPDLARAVSFYGAVLGWEVAGGSVPQGGQVTNTAPMVGLWGGDAAPPAGAHLSYRVDDVAAAVAAVRASGGAAQDPVDRGYALEAACTDPAGLQFWLHQFGPEEAAARGVPAGPISYVSLLVPDGDAARTFYGAVLGWTYDEGSPAGTTPMIGMWSGELGSAGHVSYGAVLSYTVTDIVAAVAAVRAAGGTATDPQQRPYALSSQCVDDQGVPFYLHQY